MGNIWRYLTKGDQLSPGLVIAAARGDIEVRKHNSDKLKAPPFQRYAFHRDHVRDAETAKDILTRALKNRNPGLLSAKRQTFVLYSDTAALTAALELLHG